MINNSGSYFIIQIALFLYMLFKILINLIARVFSGCYYARLVGMWAYEDAYLKNFGRDSVKLFMESYFDLVFCVCINIWALLHTPDFMAFFSTPLDAACTCLSIILSILILMYPVYGMVVIHKNQGMLHTKKL